MNHLAQEIYLEPAKIPKCMSLSREDYYKWQIYNELLLEIAGNFTHFHGIKVHGIIYDSLVQGLLVSVNYGTIDIHIRLPVSGVHSRSLYQPDILYAECFGNDWQGFYREVAKAHWSVGDPDLYQGLATWVADVMVKYYSPRSCT